MWETLKTITPGTWARSICFLLALINEGLAVFGKDKIPFVEDDVYQFVSMLATVITGAIAWWKNNSFTKKAQQADIYLKELRNECSSCEDCMMCGDAALQETEVEEDKK